MADHVKAKLQDAKGALLDRQEDEVADNVKAIPDEEGLLPDQQCLLAGTRLGEDEVADNVKAKARDEEGILPEQQRLLAGLGLEEQRVQGEAATPRPTAAPPCVHAARGG